MSRGWKTDGGKNIYFIKVKVARTIDSRLQLSNTLSEFSLIQLGCFTILRLDNLAYFDFLSILHRPYNNATELQMFDRENYNSNIDLSRHFQCTMNHFWKKEFIAFLVLNYTI